MKSISYEKGIARCLPAQEFNIQPFLSNWSLIGSQKRNYFEYLRWRLREHICKSLSFPCQLLCHMFGWSVAARCCALGRTREEQTFGASKPKSVSFHNLFQEQNLCTTWIYKFFFLSHWRKYQENTCAVSVLLSIPANWSSCFPASQPRWRRTRQGIRFLLVPCLGTVIPINAFSHVQ